MGDSHGRRVFLRALPGRAGMASRAGECVMRPRGLGPRAARTHNGTGLAVVRPHRAPGGWTRRHVLRGLAGAGALAVLACAPPTPSRAPSERVPVVGYLSVNPADYPGPPQVPHLEAFRDGLRELGYTEGHNLRIEYRFADLQF